MDSEEVRLPRLARTAPKEVLNGWQRMWKYHGILTTFHSRFSRIAPLQPFADATIASMGSVTGLMTETEAADKAADSTK